PLPTQATPTRWTLPAPTLPTRAPIAAPRAHELHRAGTPAAARLDVLPLRARLRLQAERRRRVSSGIADAATHRGTQADQALRRRHVARSWRSVWGFRSRKLACADREVTPNLLPAIT